MLDMFVLVKSLYSTSPADHISREKHQTKPTIFTQVGDTKYQFSPIIGDRNAHYGVVKPNKRIYTIFYDRYLIKYRTEFIKKKTNKKAIL